LLVRARMVGSGKVVGGHYVLGEVLGSGRTSIVYEAEQQALGRKVALKLPRRALRGAPLLRERFRVEALAGSRVRHPSIVGVFDLGEHEGTPFLVTEHVPGRLLGDFAARGRPLELGAIVELGAQLLGALSELHAAGVVHGDVRCDNVLVEPERTGIYRARLFDFGCASVAGEPARVERRTASSREADLRAMGALLYQLLTGELPPCDGVAPPSQRRPERGIPAALDAVVLRALSQDPVEQYRDAMTCAVALRAAIAGTPAETPSRTSAGPVLLAGGSLLGTRRVVDSAQLLQRREAVEDAILEGDDAKIVAAYLELARCLIDAGRHATAALELEQCVAIVGHPATPGPLWRISLTLAALYSDLGASKPSTSSRPGGVHALR
jgi:serine/threonine protein kinase